MKISINGHTVDHTTINTLYRYDIDLGHYDGVRFFLSKFPVISHTEKGFWVPAGGYIYDGCKKKWVSANSRKRFAYETEKLAFYSCVARTRKRIGILQATIMGCKTALVEAGFESEENYTYLLED